MILEVKLCVTEEGYITREEEIVCDAYSTEFSSLPEFEQLKITGEVVPINEPHMEKMSVKIDDGKISRILDIFTEQITAEASHDDRGMVISGKSTYAYWHLTGKIFLCLLSVQPIMSILFRRQTAPVPKFSVQGQQV